MTHDETGRTLIYDVMGCLTIITAGASIAAAVGIMATISEESASSLIFGGIDVIADVTSMVSWALEVENPKATTVLTTTSMATGLTGFNSLTSQYHLSCGKYKKLSFKIVKNVTCTRRQHQQAGSITSRVEFHSGSRLGTMENSFTGQIRKSLGQRQKSLLDQLTGVPARAVPTPDLSPFYPEHMGIHLVITGSQPDGAVHIYAVEIFLKKTMPIPLCFKSAKSLLLISDISRKMTIKAIAVILTVI